MACAIPECGTEQELWFGTLCRSVENSNSLIFLKRRLLEHIKNIEIKNFKSIRHQKIEDCRRINVFIGYPNTGKSNILEAIGLYGFPLINNDRFKFNDICRVKHFTELFFNKDYREATNIIINDKVLLELIFNPQSDLEVRINSIAENKLLHILSASVGKGNFSNLYYQLSDGISMIKPIKKYEFKSDATINQQGPFTLAVPFGANLLDILHRDSGLRKEIVSLFDDYNLKLVIDSEEIFFLKYLSDESAVSIPYHQIADTLRRLIFYKAAIVSNKDTVLLFEEPEAHMFPPYISKFTSEVMYNENGNQFFINTHSPFVVNDFMENLKKEELSIYAVGYKKETGETIARKLNDKEMHEIYQYGTDLFLNLENYLYHEQ
jgi:AAA15 family ATPase/GTPase